MVTFEIAHELLRYDPETGKLFWRERDRRWFPSDKACRWWNTRYAGKEAFTSINSNGYKRGSLFDSDHSAHRMIWLLHTGDWPSDQVDHINGDRADNRWANLRPADVFQNSANRCISRQNTTGFKGVTFNTQRNKYQARILVFGKLKHIGLFDTPEQAHAAYCGAAKRHHGEYARVA